MEKGTSQFCWSAGRCGAMRRGVPAGMLPRPGHAAAKAAPMGRQPRPRHGPMGKQARPRQPPWAGSQGQGMLACMLPWPRPRPWQPPWAGSQGQGTQPRPWHACVGTLACPWDPYKAMAALGGAAAAKPR